jgi:hypothetical protein
MASGGTTQDTTSVGTKARSSAWILSCSSWADQGAYIVLPINPGQLSFDLGIRTSNELTRAAQLFYVWRFFGTHSTLTKPVIKISANSGYIVPSFDPSVILEATMLSNQKAETIRSGTSAGVDVTGQAYAYDRVLQNFMAKIPAPEQTRDYITGSIYADVGLSLNANPHLNDSGLQGAGNLPSLYTTQNKTVPIGIQNLYALFSLSDERRIRKVLNKGDDRDKPTGGQTENRIMLTISTLVFPRLVIYGWFGESGIAYTESSEEPGSFDISFDIVVDDTFPRLSFGGWNNLMQTYLDNIDTQTTTLDYTKSLNT